MAALSETVAGVDGARVKAVFRDETKAFAATRPLSKALAAESAEGFHDGVPMHWMRDWPLPFPLVVAEARGAALTDVGRPSPGRLLPRRYRARCSAIRRRPSPRRSRRRLRAA